jgi:hypothetical protein
VFFVCFAIALVVFFARSNLDGVTSCRLDIGTNSGLVDRFGVVANWSN